MIIEKIESISGIVDSPFFKPVQNFPEPQAASSKSTLIKKSGSAQEIAFQFSEEAQRLRQMGQQIDQIEKTISLVKEELSTMRRTLPPFPPGSEERVRILKSYLGLRKLIEQLTIPAEVDHERFKDGITIPVLSDQATDQEWDSAVSALDTATETIQQKRTSLKTGI
jgi:hypothetical protein